MRLACWMKTDPPTASFGHDRLAVYGLSLEFVSLAREVIMRIPRARSPLAEQLERAAMSIVLNTAEGAGEFSRKEKARFYRMASRSAAECAAIFDVGLRLGLVDAEDTRRAKELLSRIVAMLTVLANRLA